jgi:hypothetical protein
MAPAYLPAKTSAIPGSDLLTEKPAIELVSEVYRATPTKGSPDMVLNLEKRD